jgi:hypothetical protein
MKTLSPSKLEANRRNAQRSTGPRTAQGKAASARNAFRHGLSSGELTVLPTEKKENLDTLIHEITEENKPTTPAEQFLVDQMVHARWNLLRARRLEAEALARLIETDPDVDRSILQTLETRGNVIEKLDRYAASAARAYSKAVRDLTQLRANAQKAAQQNKAKEADLWVQAELAKLENEPTVAPSPGPENFAMYFQPPPRPAGDRLARLLRTSSAAPNIAPRR